MKQIGETIRLNAFARCAAWRCEVVRLQPRPRTSALSGLLSTLINEAGVAPRPDLLLCRTVNKCKCTPLRFTVQQMRPSGAECKKRRPG